MAFKRITIMDIWEVVRRYQDGQNICTIARALSYDRKTIRKYLKLLCAKGIPLDQGPLDKEKVLPLLLEITAEVERAADKQSLFEPYLEEIKDLVREKDLKLKTAFSVICQRHDITGKASYTSFKRFARRHKLAFAPDPSTCRIEVDPGTQLQIDYCKCGLLLDPGRGKMRIVFAFIGTLSYSRHKFVEFTYSQDQQSFVNSHVKAFNFFGGIPKTIVLDNLKTGVITPSFYDPQFNRAYREMAEHYNCFLDPARVAKPKDKAKVERDVQTVREKFKELVAVYGQHITLADLKEKNTSLAL